MIKKGANRARLVAKIAGGAKMFAISSGASNTINVGDRNAQASRKKLKELGVRLVSEDCGLNYGRTVEIMSEDGRYVIKSVGKPVKSI